MDILSEYEETQQMQIIEKLQIDLVENNKQYEISKEAFLATKESLNYSQLSFDAGKVNVF